MYIHHIVSTSRCLGPGNRFVIWVQGCERNCFNCFSPKTQSIGSGGVEITIDDIFFDILKVKGINGVTISGGEPFLQVEELMGLVLKIKNETHLDIMIYTGYTLEELYLKNSSSILSILENIDILVDGEYIDDKNSNSIYRGSDNQKFHFLSDKYIKYREKLYSTKNRTVEFDIGDSVFIVGIPPKEDQNILKNIDKAILMEDK